MWLNQLEDVHAYLLSRFSPVQLFATAWTVAHQDPLSMDSPGKNTGVGCPALLQGIFLTQYGTLYKTSMGLMSSANIHNFLYQRPWWLSW